MREDRENLIIENAQLRMPNYNTAVSKFSEPSIKLSIPFPEELQDSPGEELAVPEADSKKAYSVEEFRTRHREAYKPWSADYDTELSVLVAGGTKVKELSAHFGRTSGAIRSRIKKLNLRE